MMDNIYSVLHGDRKLYVDNGEGEWELGCVEWPVLMANASDATPKIALTTTGTERLWRS